MMGPFNPTKIGTWGSQQRPKKSCFWAKYCHLWTFQKPHSDNFWKVKSPYILLRIFHVMFSPQAAMFKPFLAARADYGQI